MLVVALIIVAVIAAGLLAMVLSGRQKTAEVTAERDNFNRQLNETTVDLQRTNDRLETAESQIASLDEQRTDLIAESKRLTTDLEESATALRKRTELADAQAMQIDSLSAARDELQQQLTSAEEQIVTLAARPGVVVGELANDDANAEMLWDLEVARSERAWRNSVAINPVDDPSPFESTSDPVHTAVQIEASALREDVGAMIDVDWQAKPIEAASRRLLVVRVAQEMLSLAARAPGAAKLVVTQEGEDEGDLKMEFEAADESSQVINLIPPQISNELIDVRSESGLSLTVRAD